MVNENVGTMHVPLFIKPWILGHRKPTTLAVYHEKVKDMFVLVAGFDQDWLVALSAARVI